jgi:hypothetical protein
MPSTNQSGTGETYPSEAHRHIAEWPTDWLLKLEPTPEVAKTYLEACGDYNANQEVKDHFAAIVLS